MLRPTYTVTVANGPTAVPPFQLDADPGGALPSQQANPSLVAGTYRVSIVGGNNPKSITCTNGQQVSNYASTFIGVTMRAGSNITCTFYVEWIG